MNSELKVNLSLLKRLMSELESSVARAESTGSKNGEATEYVVEMAKAAGLAAGVVQEATMLIGDIKTAIKLNTAYQQGAGGVDKDLADLFNLGGSGKPGTN